MTWTCERVQCGDTYPHKHLCSCQDFMIIEIHGVLEYICYCEYFDGDYDE